MNYITRDCPKRVMFDSASKAFNIMQVYSKEPYHCMASHKIWVDEVIAGIIQFRNEYLNTQSFINHQAVVPDVDYYIRYYNNKRIHSAIGNISPALKRHLLLNAA